MRETLTYTGIGLGIGLIMLAFIPYMWLIWRGCDTCMEVFQVFFWYYVICATAMFLGSVRLLWEARHFIKAQIKARRKRRQLLDSEFNEHL